MIIRAERKFKNPNGKTRRIEEHFNGFRVFFKLEEGEEEQIIRVPKDELPFDAEEEDFKEYILENEDLAEYSHPLVQKLCEENKELKESQKDQDGILTELLLKD